MSMFIGESLVGEGNEVAHIDLMIGDKNGPVGHAFAQALANQKQGFSNLLAVLTPNLIAKPATVLITKVTIKGAGQAVTALLRASFPRVMPTTWLLSVECSSIGKPRMTRKSTTIITKLPNNRSSAP
jgi:hypothetical protein